MRVFRPLRGRATGRNWAADDALCPWSPGVVRGGCGLGALCPLMRVVLGACGDTSGDRRWPAPVWKSPFREPLPRPLSLALSYVIVEVVMAQRQPTWGRSKPALPPQLAAVHLHAAGLDVGAEAHDVAVPPRDDLPPVRCVGASTVACAALADGWAPCGSATGALESTGVSGLPLCELVESREFEVRRVAPPQVRQIRGRPDKCWP
jgi:hypothetical protein